MSDRLFPLIDNPQGKAFTDCMTRFIVCVAGRRSGKTERAKRKIIRRAILGPTNGRYACCAPTREQAKALFWEDLKAMVPRELLACEPSESGLCITLIHGPRIFVIGLDKPQRIEGVPWDGVLMDEVDDMKPETWEAHIRPGLSDRQGFAWFIGVPEGFSKLYELHKNAFEAKTKHQWSFFTWPSSEVLPPEEVDDARCHMDPRLFRQEYEASFEAPAGRIYEDFSRKLNVRDCPIDPNLPLLCGMDFNIDPMTAVLCQLHGEEVWVPAIVEQRHSNTTRLGKYLMETYGSLELWVDASGNARQHAMGVSDVDILRQLGHKVFFRQVLRESDKYNAVRAMVCSAAGTRRLYIDPSCQRLIERMEQLGPDDEDDHLTDALGYLILGKLNPVQRFKEAAKWASRTSSKE